MKNQLLDLISIDDLDTVKTETISALEKNTKSNTNWENKSNHITTNGSGMNC